MPDNNNDLNEKESKSTGRGSICSSHVAAPHEYRSSSPKLLSQDYILDELQWYRSLARSDNMQEFVANFIAQISAIGFSDFSYYNLSRSAQPSLRISTLPSIVSKCCASNDAYRFDPVFEYAASNTRAIFQSTITEYLENAPFTTSGFIAVIEMQKLLQEMGYEDQYCIPIKADQDHSSALLVVTSRYTSAKTLRKRAVEHDVELRLLARALHYIGNKQFPSYFIDQNAHAAVKMSPKSLFLLNALAKEDLTLKQAADKLCMSESTTNKHIAAIKQALRVRTLWGAVYLAGRSGLIS